MWDEIPQDDGDAVDEAAPRAEEDGPEIQPVLLAEYAEEAHVDVEEDVEGYGDEGDGYFFLSRPGTGVIRGKEEEMVSKEDSYTYFQRRGADSTISNAEGAPITIRSFPPRLVANAAILEK